MIYKDGDKRWLTIMFDPLPRHAPNNKHYYYKQPMCIVTGEEFCRVRKRLGIKQQTLATLFSNESQDYIWVAKYISRYERSKKNRLSIERVQTMIRAVAKADKKPKPLRNERIGLGA